MPKDLGFGIVTSLGCDPEEKRKEFLCIRKLAK